MCGATGAPTTGLWFPFHDLNWDAAGQESVVGTLSGVLRIKLSIRTDSADSIAALGRIPNKWLGQVVSFRSPVKVDEPRRWW